jgi:DNA-binding MarR family transcriptional regulator
MGKGNRDPRETARQLNSGAIHVLRSLRLVDRRSGLTPARLSALSVLVFGGPCTLGRLAAIEDVAGPTMTRIVDGLCREGLAQRTRHPDSGRAVLISATPTGDDLMRAAADRRVDALVSAMSRLDDAAQHSLESAAPALVSLAEALRRPASDAAVAAG